MQYEKLKALLDAGVSLHAVFESIDSTNTYLKKLCNTETVADKTAVLAESQSGGRGRLGRSFVSPKGNGIYLSVAFAADYTADVALRITAAAAVAVCRVLDAYAKEKAQIKWVNDVYLGGRKVCGILTEAVTDTQCGGIKNIIVGIGLNMCGYDAFPEELKPIVTTLEQHSENVPSPEELAAALINSLCALAQNLPDSDWMAEYRERSFVIGKAVRVLQNGQERNATVSDIDADGGLCVVYEDGENAVLRSAEISIRTK